MSWSTTVYGSGWLPWTLAWWQSRLPWSVWPRIVEAWCYCLLYRWHRTDLWNHIPNTDHHINNYQFEPTRYSTLSSRLRFHVQLLRFHFFSDDSWKSFVMWEVRSRLYESMWNVTVVLCRSSRFTEVKTSKETAHWFWFCFWWVFLIILPKHEFYCRLLEHGLFILDVKTGLETFRWCWLDRAQIYEMSCTPAIKQTYFRENALM